MENGEPFLETEGVSRNHDRLCAVVAARVYTIDRGVDDGQVSLPNSWGKLLMMGVWFLRHMEEHMTKTFGEGHGSMLLASFMPICPSFFEVSPRTREGVRTNLAGPPTQGKQHVKTVS